MLFRTGRLHRRWSGFPPPAHHLLSSSASATVPETRNRMTTTRLCPDTVQLQRFVARDLSENAYTLVEEHIRQCGNCEEAITALSQTGYSLIACNDEAPQTRMPQR